MSSTGPEAEADLEPEMCNDIGTSECDSHQVGGETIDLLGEKRSESVRIQPHKPAYKRKSDNKRTRVQSKSDNNFGTDKRDKARFDSMDSSRDVVVNLSKYKLTS